MKNGSNLSGGQKQKIGLARALINKPKMLLLDEATSNIDEKSKPEIFSYIYSLEGVTVISISHDKSTLKYLLIENEEIKIVDAEKNTIVTN
ncbi:ATP-binding cassette domain-containing protein [Virgibacillus sp. Bac330]|uniref:ATP-binding cassette domain-containing protein n=1 Tax=Virgibacillus sp. Bac330 TaxID=2419841 RepID=UPI000EF4F360|nr:ATP-binding cassette domain-containing protein [Virgibacillus sp. Bac330]